MFIAWELCETFDPDADDQQITTAVGTMQRAADCLNDVVQAPANLSAARLAA